MQNLLGDPLFYHLLTSNDENSTLEPQSNPQPHHQHHQQQPFYIDAKANEDVSNIAYRNEEISNIDFSFLDKFLPLNMNFDGQVKKEECEMDFQTQTPSENSYAASVFSQDNHAVESSIGSIGDSGSMNDNMNDFIPKESRANSNITSQLSTPKPESKQFHKFYTSTFNTKGNNLTTTTQVSKPLLSYHRCPFCQRQFKNKSYLSRHLKKHDTVKDFKCPFFNESSTKCHHLNGEFSRKDTFKAHLKSIHFIYPIGVAKRERNSSTGRCAGCFKEFANNTVWLSDHIDKNECPGFAIAKDSI